MKVIDQYTEFITPIDGDTILKRIETCGRVCYKSEDKITDDSAKKFCAGIIKRGHEAVLEHCSFTVRFVTDRSVTHEIVRHRLAAYCQESQRYCNYGLDKFDNGVTVIKPVYLTPGTILYDKWYTACEDSEAAYLDMLDLGATPQEARAVLPNSTKTELCMTANIREWRHFFKLRCSPAAHPQIRALAVDLLHKCQEKISVLFDDITDEG